jgi:hypothetical protein
MTNRWNQREKHIGLGGCGIPPARPCSKRRPTDAPAKRPTSGPVDPWLAMDVDLFVRRVSSGFSEIAGVPAPEFVGQPIFNVLSRLGVEPKALDRVFELAVKGCPCFVELPPGSIGRASDHFAVEIRPIPEKLGWVIRYVAVAWTVEGLRAAQNGPAWISAGAPVLDAFAEASPLEFPASDRFHRGRRRSRLGSGRDEPNG